MPARGTGEKAARGGASGHRFPWSDANTISHRRANYLSEIQNNLAYDVSPTSGFHPKYKTGKDPWTSPVGSFPANEYGLYDMAGNVFEWCWDWAGSMSGDIKADPHGPNLGTERIIRGGSWRDNAWVCRVSFRYSDSQLLVSKCVFTLSAATP